jgi:hypothetical protein
MSSQSKRRSSLAELAHEENALPEQIMASALALYAALPAAVCSAHRIRAPMPVWSTSLCGRS